MKNKLLIALVMTGVLFLSACDEDQDYIEYINRSSMDIYIYKSYSSQSILPLEEEYLGRVIHRYYKGGRFQSYTDYIYPDYTAYDTLYTTLVSVDTINKYSWETVHSQNMILRCDTIPLDESYLKSIDYKMYYFDD